MPVTQCAAVTARSPCGLSTTLAVQKWLPSLPFELVNSAPTAGVPLIVWAFWELETVPRNAFATCVAISEAAPFAGVTGTTTPRVRVPTTESRPDGRENQAAARIPACRLDRRRVRTVTSLLPWP